MNDNKANLSNKNVFMKKVIVVEDNLLISVIYRHYLEKLNYKIIAEVITGEEAIEILRNEEVDLIIMDIMLEGEVNGIDAMKEIRKTQCTPVIFASGNSDDLNFRKASEVANSTFLVKPVTACDFSEAVERMVDMKGVA